MKVMIVVVLVMMVMMLRLHYNSIAYSTRAVGQIDTGN